jgi:hypothetical protein
VMGKEGMNEESQRDRSLDEIYFFIGRTAECEGCKYIIEVEEGTISSEKKPSGINFAASSEEVSWRGDAGGSGGGGRAKEGCSCLYGNPCMDQYVCSDWAHRFEVAKKNGWKG